jgi:lipoprotein-releasing system ATP-binding protein
LGFTGTEFLGSESIVAAGRTAVRPYMLMDNLTLSAAGLVKRFPQGDRDVEILHGIDLDLREGEIVAIIGPSGAGKSTLLHLLGLMEQPTAGTLKIQGEEVQSLAPKERARLRNEYIGFLFQFHHLLPELTVLENVMLPQRIQGVSEHQAAAQAAMLLDTIGLRDHFYKHPMNLSGGEQQRVALARALVNEPALLLADEPTGNLDKETGEGVLKLLWEESRRRNAAAVIVTHQEDIALRADRCIRLRDGRIEPTASSPQRPSLPSSPTVSGGGPIAS